MFRAQVLRALNRIGNNVNQIARALNSDYTPPDIRERLDELHHLLADRSPRRCANRPTTTEAGRRVIAAIKPPGANTRGLLAYLYGPGSHDEHLDPHIVAGFAMLGMPDPGRDEHATLTELGHHLDAPVALRNSEFGKPVTDHVWHCPVRAAPEDRHLSDTEWGEIAQRIVAAAGIAPDGDDLACRWIAVRHADDHIHILATTVREDGRRPKLHDSGIRVGNACREIEKDYGLRQLNKGDRTATRAPTQAEMHKASRLGWEQTSRAVAPGPHPRRHPPRRQRRGTPRLPRSQRRHGQDRAAARPATSSATPSAAPATSTRTASRSTTPAGRSPPTSPFPS